MKFIIPMIVGGIIGYITNWLAIKMLFRPHRQVRIFGVGLPFTPGLIPKERNRIAKSVGATVGEHLLSPEIVTDALSKPEINKEIRIWIETSLYRLKRDDHSLKDVINVLGIEKYKALLESIKVSIIEFIYYKLNSDNFKEDLINFIEFKLFDRYKDDIYKLLNLQGGEFLYNLSNSDKFQYKVEENIRRFIENLDKDERTLKEVIPQDIIDNLNRYVDGEKDNIANSIREIINTPEVKDRLKSSLAYLVDQNVNRVITMFISPEQISEKVFSALEKYIDSPDTDEVIIFITKNLLDRVLNNTVSHISQATLDIITKDDLSFITNIVLENLKNKENHIKLLELLQESIQSSEYNIKQKISEFISNNMENMINSVVVKEILEKLVEDTLSIIEEKPISCVFTYLDEDKINSITDFLNIQFNNLAKVNLPKIIKKANISNIVEEQINSFEVEYAEELILDIAKKELNAITWLGALLGMIMGLLTPILQLLS